MESETHSHVPVRRKDAAPVPDVKDVEHGGGQHAHALTRDEVLAWIGFKAVDENGHAVGKIEDVYAVDDRPEWVLVKHHRSHHFLAPIADAIGGGDQVFLPYDKEKIESAPEVDPGLSASEAVIAVAREHYGLD
jgi:hypothetical protein